MIDFEDIAYSVLALWGAIIAFLTAPLWGCPYLICKSISGGKER